MKRALIIVCLLFVISGVYCQQEIRKTKGELTKISPSQGGGDGQVFKVYSDAACTKLVGTAEKGEKVEVRPEKTTTYYGRWEGKTGYSTVSWVKVIVEDKTPPPTLPTPAINIIVEIPTINSGESTTLSYSGGSGNVFRWYTGSCGGTLVGENNNLRVAPTVTTTYYGRWENGNEVSECQKITVTVKKRNDEGMLDLGYAIWKGKIKNGKPHDVQGSLTFKQKHRIDKNDVKERIANAGDKVIGEFEDGRLIQGMWYKSNGEIEAINIGSIK